MNKLRFLQYVPPKSLRSLRSFICAVVIVTQLTSFTPLIEHTNPKPLSQPKPISQISPPKNNTIPLSQPKHISQTNSPKNNTINYSTINNQNGHTQPVVKISDNKLITFRSNFNNPIIETPNDPIIRTLTSWIRFTKNESRWYKMYKKGKGLICNSTLKISEVIMSIIQKLLSVFQKSVIKIITQHIQ